MTRVLRRRIQRLETSGDVGGPTPFFWPRGVSLADALAKAGLSLEDGPLMAIEYIGYRPSPNGPEEVLDPVHDRDRHLLG